MRTYQFRYLDGKGGMSYKTIPAENDEDFSQKLASWEKESGFRHVPWTMSWSEGLFTQKRDRDSFLARCRSQSSTPQQALSHFQKPMESGGA